MRTLLLLLLACFAEAFAGEETPQIKELSPTLFQIGEVRLDKTARRITFPASINMRDGVLEYLLVSDTGKTHESLLVTKAEPSHLHIAMLLLGAKGAPARDSSPPAQIDAKYLQSAPELTGDDVEISVSWSEGDKEPRVAAEELIMNTEQKTPLKKGPWIYNGSFVSNGTFLAQAEGSIVALVTDPAALINNPRPGHQNDLVWTARSDKSPPVGTAVELTITLQSKKTSP